MKRWLYAMSPALLITQCAPDECAPTEAPPEQVVEWEAGNCASFAEEAADAGLPWGIFGPIARRESGCNPNVWVVDHDDNGGGLFGFNFIGSMINYWPNLCGMSKGEVRGNVPLQMQCAAAEYNAHGLRAWR